MREVPVRKFFFNNTNVSDGKVTTVEVDINSVVHNISYVTEPMCEGIYSTNYSILVQDKIFFGPINKTIVVNNGIPCTVSPSPANPTTSNQIPPLPSTSSPGCYMYMLEMFF